MCGIDKQHSKSNTTAVIGIGNILLRDDGVGIHVVEQLQKKYVGEKVTFVDGGTCIFDLVDIFIKHKRIIVIDALQGGHAPGTIYKIPAEELKDYIKANTSLHDVQILDILQDVKWMGYDPSVIIMGIEPKEVTYGLELSEEIKEQIPQLIQWVQQELRKAGECCA